MQKFNAIEIEYNGSLNRFGSARQQKRASKISAWNASMDATQSHRTFFAHLVASAAGAAKNDRLVEAFASTPREKYLGPGPWKIFAGSSLIETPSDDPVFLYQNVVVALAPDRHINNGQPVLHGICLAALNIQPGEKILHVGAGTGYYTSILAKLTSPTGSVEAYEIEPDLAARATTNLADQPNITVHTRNASQGPLPPADVIYINAGATTPLDTWLDALRPNARLLFPLTSSDGPGGIPGAGAMLLITCPARQFTPNIPRNSAASARAASLFDTFAARFLSPAIFIPCVGARDDSTAAKLAEAFKRSDTQNVRSLRRHTPPDSTAWCAGENWWLSTAAMP
jgi:protein-L-isoaspartate(D-aspartate) O-methyltransferase